MVDSHDEFGTVAVLRAHPPRGNPQSGAPPEVIGDIIASLQSLLLVGPQSHLALQCSEPPLHGGILCHCKVATSSARLLRVSLGRALLEALLLWNAEKRAAGGSGGGSWCHPMQGGAQGHLPPWPPLGMPQIWCAENMNTQWIHSGYIFTTYLCLFCINLTKRHVFSLGIVVGCLWTIRNICPHFS